MKSRWLLLIPPLLLFLSLSNSVFASLCLFFLTSFFSVCIRSVQSLSHVRLFVIPWTAAHQASLSITNSLSLLKRMSVELVMPSDYLTLWEQALGVGDGQRSLVCCSPWGRKESDMTEGLNWTTYSIYLSITKKLFLDAPSLMRYIGISIYFT